MLRLSVITLLGLAIHGMAGCAWLIGIEDFPDESPDAAPNESPDATTEALDGGSVAADASSGCGSGMQSSNDCPLCPDGTCNGDETCSSCPDDCGSCSCGASNYWTPNSMSAQDPAPSPFTNIGMQVELQGQASNTSIKLRICKTTGTLQNALHVRFYEQVRHTFGNQLLDQTLPIDSSTPACTEWSEPISTSNWEEGEGFGGDVKVTSPATCDSAWENNCSNPDPGCGYCWFISTGVMTRTCKGF